MYEYINGKITDVSPYHIVVENNGLGYLVYVANPFSYQVESQQKVYLYQAVRDNDISLYGFKNKVEKQETDIANLILRRNTLQGKGMHTFINFCSRGTTSSK